NVEFNAVTLGEAFCDLPPLFDHLDKRSSSKRAQNPDLETKYLKTKKFEKFPFIKDMRTWPEFENFKDTFTGHIIRNTPRDYDIFKHMPEGGMYPDAHKTALLL